MMERSDILTGAGAKVHDIAPVINLLLHCLAQPAAAEGCLDVSESESVGDGRRLRNVGVDLIARVVSMPAHSARKRRKSVACSVSTTWRWRRREGGRRQVLCLCGVAVACG